MTLCFANLNRPKSAHATKTSTIDLIILVTKLSKNGNVPNNNHKIYMSYVHKNTKSNCVLVVANSPQCARNTAYEQDYSDDE